jgi:predicted transcriptional regulator
LEYFINLPLLGYILNILHILAKFYAIIIITIKVLLIKVVTHRNRYRNRIEIICKILQVANDGVTKKTEMMHKANLSYTQLKEYMIVLTQGDLLRYDFNTQTFKTTEKGLSLLEAYNQMNHTLKEKQI